ncbi:hypothetical protein, partial [Actinokineospora terrae]|uniref:hypothetical protein n=1 Tax=Actinokineospora terrae TaxID=155974 RepID=UPI001C433FDB
QRRPSRVGEDRNEWQTYDLRDPAQQRRPSQVGEDRNSYDDLVVRSPRYGSADPRGSARIATMPSCSRRARWG